MPDWLIGTLMLVGIISVIAGFRGGTPGPVRMWIGIVGIALFFVGAFGAAAADRTIRVPTGPGTPNCHTAPR